jgi:alanine racemase
MDNHLATPKHYNRVTPVSSFFTEPQSFIELSTSAFNHNVTYYKKIIGHYKKIAAVIKGNGYGHGLVEMGQLCQNNSDIDYLCTINSTEALELRIAGITKPILILGYINSPLDMLIHTPIVCMIDTINYAYILNNIGSMYNKKILVHIKIDTGLSRFGIHPSELYSFTQQLSHLKFIHVDGIFSHFIASDTNKELSQQQLSLLHNTVQLIHPVNNVHCSNTMSVESLDYASLFNVFRIGLGLYGFSNHEHTLQPVLEWKSRIMAIKTVPANSYVSYGCTYKTTKEIRLGLIPVGYANGYQFRFSTHSLVRINNVLAQVVGRVGMNVTMVDITNIPAHVGDIVTLIGSQHPLQAIDLAQNNAIANIRELLTGLNSSILRNIVD